MITKRLRLALALATTLCASAAHAANCVYAPANSGQCCPTMILVDPTTALPYAAPGGGGGSGSIVNGPTANGAAPSGASASPVLNGFLDGAGLVRTLSPSNPLPTLDIGSPNLNVNQASPTTTATLIGAARAGRRAITIENLGTTAVYIGGAGVTTATGALLQGMIGASVTIPTQAAVFGLAAAGTSGGRGPPKSTKYAPH